MKIDEVLREIINKQLEPHGKTMEDIIGLPDWYQKFTCTQEEEAEWIQFGIDLMRKKLKWSKKRATSEMAWVTLNWGLRVV